AGRTARARSRTGLFGPSSRGSTYSAAIRPFSGFTTSVSRVIFILRHVYKHASDVSSGTALLQPSMSAKTPSEITEEVRSVGGRTGLRLEVSPSAHELDLHNSSRSA